MNLHLLPAPIWWAEQAGEDLAMSRQMMARARSAKFVVDRADYVKHARYYRREYRLHLKSALSYLKQREQRLTMVPVPSDVLPVHPAHSHER